MIDGCMSLMTMHYAVWNSKAMPSRGRGLLAGQCTVLPVLPHERRPLRVGRRTRAPILCCAVGRSGRRAGAGPDGHGSVATIENGPSRRPSPPGRGTSGRSDSRDATSACSRSWIRPRSGNTSTSRRVLPGPRRGRFHRFRPSAERHLSRQPRMKSTAASRFCLRWDLPQTRSTGRVRPRTGCTRTAWAGHPICWVEPASQPRTIT